MCQSSEKEPTSRKAISELKNLSSLCFPITGHFIICLYKSFLSRQLCRDFISLNPRESWDSSFSLSISKVITDSGLQRSKDDEGSSEIICEDKKDWSYSVNWNPGMTSPQNVLFIWGSCTVSILQLASGPVGDHGRIGHKCLILKPFHFFASQGQALEQNFWRG